MKGKKEHLIRERKFGIEIRFIYFCKACHEKDFDH